jgi:single-stranded-DNA-specific exonuclease
MPLQQYDWNMPKPIPENIKFNLQDYSDAFQSILYQRGITTAQDAINFLFPNKKAWYSDHYLRQLETACHLIKQAVENKELIAVYGDYDADGITGTALLVLALQRISGQVIPFLPNRFDSGYGLNTQAISELYQKGVKLLITVDNGIRSISEISYANSLGMTVIVTDHHDPDGEVPNAAALINPKMPDETYPNKNLAGVGVTYKLICGLSSYFPDIKPEDYLDLVAIGTVADVVPILGENRYLVRRGLSIINTFQRQGIVSLLGAANLTQNKITSNDISFQIAPRLNAAGRLDVDSSDAPLRLLLSSDPAICGTLAQELEIHNTQRKIISQKLQERILSEISPTGLTSPILFSFNENNHLGVAGIAAGFFTRKYYLPAVIGQIGDDFTTASCRSIPEFNIIDALDQCRGLFERYGGHALAAGFTIKNSNLPALQEHLGSLAEEILSSRELLPVLNIDAEINFDQVADILYKELEKLEPTGSQNHQALFLTRNLSATKLFRVGKSSEHLKLSVSDGKYQIAAIGFGMGEIFEQIPEKFDLVYHLTVNPYQGKNEFQLQITDIKPA